MKDAAKINWKSPKLSETLRSLPRALRPHFRRLVEDITFSCVGRGAPIRNWAVLAELVTNGWRRLP